MATDWLFGVGKTAHFLWFRCRGGCPGVVFYTVTFFSREPFEVARVQSCEYEQSVERGWSRPDRLLGAGHGIMFAGRRLAGRAFPRLWRLLGSKTTGPPQRVIRCASLPNGASVRRQTTNGLLLQDSPPPPSHSSVGSAVTGLAGHAHPHRVPAAAVVEEPVVRLARICQRARAAWHVTLDSRSGLTRRFDSDLTAAIVSWARCSDKLGVHGLASQQLPHLLGMGSWHAVCTDRLRYATALATGALQQRTACDTVSAPIRATRTPDSCS